VYLTYGDLEWHSNPETFNGIPALRVRSGRFGSRIPIPRPTPTPSPVPVLNSPP
jgi:hypothetical protein